MISARRVAAAMAVVLLLAASTGCRIDEGDTTMTPTAPLGSGAAATVLPPVGPIPGTSHWHAPYVVRICDDVLEPFESDNDPLGIHSHGDGVMHVHPFGESSGFENATLGLFADAMGFGLADGELRLPGGGVWRDGDLCDGVAGRVFVDRWEGPDPGSDVMRHFEDLAALRFLADGELYQIAFAPADSTPVVPPSVDLLPQLSDLSPPAEPPVDIDPAAVPADVELFEITGVSSTPCPDGVLPDRVVSGPVRCFGAGNLFPVDASVRSARAVTLNRRPAVEIDIAHGMLIDALRVHFLNPDTRDQPYALAIAVAGKVVGTVQVVRQPVSVRLIVSGGFSVESAQRLADLLDGA